MNPQLSNRSCRTRASPASARAPTPRPSTCHRRRNSCGSTSTSPRWARSWPRHLRTPRMRWRPRSWRPGSRTSTTAAHQWNSPWFWPPEHDHDPPSGSRTTTPSRGCRSRRTHRRPRRHLDLLRHRRRRPADRSAPRTRRVQGTLGPSPRRAR